MRWLAFALALSSWPVAAQGPLEQLAAGVPASAGGRVVLSDIGASADQTRLVAPAFGETDRRIMALMPLTFIDGFEPSGAFATMQSDGFPPPLGVRLMSGVRIASWSMGQDAPVVLEGLTDRMNEVSVALVKAGFSRKQRADGPVWHIGSDFEKDAARERADPFAGNFGHSGRFAWRGGQLVYARSWPGLEALLTEQPGLNTIDPVASMLQASYRVEGRGALLEAIVLGPQISRADAVSAYVGRGPGAAAMVADTMKAPGYQVPPVPAFERHALFLWQESRRISGAIAMPYPDRDTAELAIQQFDPLSETLESLHAKRAFARLFPYTSWREVVETDKGWVALIGFEQVIDVDPPTPYMFIINPYDRLRDMLMTGDLALLLAGR